MASVDDCCVVDGGPSDGVGVLERVFAEGVLMVRDGTNKREGEIMRGGRGREIEDEDRR